VAVLEARPEAVGVTGYTTAKVTALQATAVSDIVSRLGADRAAAYAAAIAAAVGSYLPDQLSTPVDTD
jgi:hypothetical protein